MRSIPVPMFPTAPGLAIRLTCNATANGPHGEIELYDACLDDGPDVVVFEFTSKFILDDLVLGNDPGAASFVSEVDEKYGPKLRQLARAALLVDVDRSSVFDQCTTVFPVLCVFDTRLSMEEVGRHLNTCLKVTPLGSLLCGLGARNHAGWRIARRLLAKLNVHTRQVSNTLAA